MLALVNAFVAFVPAREAEFAHFGGAEVVGLATKARDQFFHGLAANRALGERRGANALKGFKGVVAELAFGFDVLVFVDRHEANDNRQTGIATGGENSSAPAIFRNRPTALAPKSVTFPYTAKQFVSRYSRTRLNRETVVKVYAYACYAD